MRCATTATATVLTTTSPTASSRIGRRFARNSARSVDHPPLNSSGGRTERKIQSGAMRTGGKPGTNASAVPASTNTIGYGSAKRLATTASATAAARPRTSRTGSLIAADPPGGARLPAARMKAGERVPHVRREDGGLPGQIDEAIESVAELERKALESASLEQRAIERFTLALGRPRTVWIILAIVAAWAAVNVASP